MCRVLWHKSEKFQQKLSAKKNNMPTHTAEIRGFDWFGRCWFLCNWTLIESNQKFSILPK